MSKLVAVGVFIGLSNHKLVTMLRDTLKQNVLTQWINFVTFCVSRFVKVPRERNTLLHILLSSPSISIPSTCSVNLPDLVFHTIKTELKESWGRGEEEEVCNAGQK
jgi:hypothetical protein